MWGGANKVPARTLIIQATFLFAFVTQLNNDQTGKYLLSLRFCNISFRVSYWWEWSQWDRTCWPSCGIPPCYISTTKNWHDIQQWKAADPQLQDRVDWLQLMSSKWFQAPPDMLAVIYKTILYFTMSKYITIFEYQHKALQTPKHHLFFIVCQWMR